MSDESMRGGEVPFAGLRRNARSLIVGLLLVGAIFMVVPDIAPRPSGLPPVQLVHGRIVGAGGSQEAAGRCAARHCGCGSTTVTPPWPATGSPEKPIGGPSSSFEKSITHDGSESVHMRCGPPVGCACAARCFSSTKQSNDSAWHVNSKVDEIGSLETHSYIDLLLQTARIGNSLYDVV
jgi:hypothetical protein